MAAAPEPLTTTLTFLSLRPVRWQALMMPAAVMIAVPCWSSWKTGMLIRSRSACSMMKQDGASIFSRLLSQNLHHPLDRVDEAVCLPGVTLDIRRIQLGATYESPPTVYHPRPGAGPPAG